MMRRTPMPRQKTPMKRSAWNAKPAAQKAPGLAQRIAKALGVDLQHRRKPEPVFRSLKHRQNVARLPCICCGRWGRSQAAHLNLLALGKGKGVKVSDALLMPLCADDVGIRGCHHKLDQGAAYDKATSAAMQIKWLQETRTLLMKLGDWPEAAEKDIEKFLNTYLARQ